MNKCLGSLHIEIAAEGEFLQEESNRFICRVLVDGKEQLCYVPSSSRLCNYLNLEGKRVLLTPIKAKTASMQLALIAMPWKRSYILLNSSLANAIIEHNITGRRFHYLGQRAHVIKEHRLGSYKADFFIEDTKTIVEVKSVISSNDIASFPTVYSERSDEQLKVLLSYLKQGYKACYIIVSLNPYTKEIVLYPNMSWTEAILGCINAGMLIKGYSCRLNSKQFLVLDHEVPIRFYNASANNAQ